MSELRVALIAEGPTDSVIIEAALKAILGDRPFTLTTLQPEATASWRGTGWCGVFKWCREFATRSFASLVTDPTLPGFDLFVIHVDVDVADLSYADGGAAVSAAAQGLPSLPRKDRIKKTRRDYMQHGGSVTREWARVTRTCTQAERFQDEVHAALGPTSATAD